MKTEKTTKEIVAALPPLEGKAAMAAKLVELIDTAAGPLEALYRIKVFLTDRFPRDYDGDLVQELIEELNDAVHGHCARIVMKAELGPLVDAVLVKQNNKKNLVVNIDTLVGSITINDMANLSDPAINDKVRAAIEGAVGLPVVAPWEKPTYEMLNAQYLLARAAKQKAVIMSFHEGRKPMAPMCIALAEVLDDFEGLLEEGLLDEFIAAFGPAISAGWRAALGAITVMLGAIADDEMASTREYVQELHSRMWAQPDALAGMRCLAKDWQSPSLAHMPTLKAVHHALDSAVDDVLGQRLSAALDTLKGLEAGKEVADVND